MVEILVIVCRADEDAIAILELCGKQRLLDSGRQRSGPVPGIVQTAFQEKAPYMLLGCRTRCPSKRSEVTAKIRAPDKPYLRIEMLADGQVVGNSSAEPDRIVGVD